MKERPILFSGPMVRAIIEGRKTQTRRLVKRHFFRPGHGGTTFEKDWKDVGTVRRVASDWRCYLAAWAGVSIGTLRPYAEVGDHLWIRETYSHGPTFNADQDYSTRLRFRANAHDSPLPAGQKWRPSIFMPRCFSRITLEVMGVRVERLLGISEADAKAEGVERDMEPCDHVRRSCGDIGCMGPTYRSSFCELWGQINGKRAPWAANPWVFAVTFRVLNG